MNLVGSWALLCIKLRRELFRREESKKELVWRAYLRYLRKDGPKLL